MKSLVDKMREVWDNPEELRALMDAEFDKNPPKIVDYTGSFPDLPQGKLKDMRKKK